MNQRRGERPIPAPGISRATWLLAEATPEDLTEAITDLGSKIGVLEAEITKARDTDGRAPRHLPVQKEQLKSFMDELISRRREFAETLV
jgi:hypothetical protein